MEECLKAGHRSGTGECRTVEARAARFGNAVGHLYGACDMVADVVIAYEFVDIALEEYLPNLFVDTGKHNMDALFLRGADEKLEVVYAGSIYEWHAAHADDTYGRHGAAHGSAHHFVELGSHPEEERAVDLVYFHAWSHIEHFM